MLTLLAGCKDDAEVNTEVVREAWGLIDHLYPVSERYESPSDARLDLDNARLKQLRTTSTKAYKERADAI